MSVEQTKEFLNATKGQGGNTTLEKVASGLYGGRRHHPLNHLKAHGDVSFAFFSVVICSVILLYFNFFVFITLALCVCVELFWIFNYLEIMKRIDYKNFSLQSIDQNMLFESVNSILDIKLNNLEKLTRNQWKKIQIGISNNNISKLRVEQKYECYRFIDYIQYILITAICATEIIDKQMTIGTYFSIMMIIGALNQPISQLINFTLKYKLTKVSLDVTIQR